MIYYSNNGEFDNMLMEFNRTSCDGIVVRKFLIFYNT
jgi:hypothetical protein